jgi:hypothetical protein
MSRANSASRCHDAKRNKQKHTDNGITKPIALMICYIANCQIVYQAGPYTKQVGNYTTVTTQCLHYLSPTYHLVPERRSIITCPTNRICMQSVWNHTKKVLPYQAAPSWKEDGVIDTPTFQPVRIHHLHQVKRISSGWLAPPPDDDLIWFEYAKITCSLDVYRKCSTHDWVLDMKFWRHNKLVGDGHCRWCIVDHMVPGTRGDETRGKLLLIQLQ